MAASWSLRGTPVPVGSRVPLDRDNITVRVFRTQRPARMDDYASAGGPAARRARAIGVRAAVGTPVVVEGRLWGVMFVGSSGPGPLPAGMELRIGAFTELVAMAIANAEARRALKQVAAEQAALSRVATLVAEAVPPGEVFTAVAAEVAGLFGVPLAGLVRYETDFTATVIAGAAKPRPTSYYIASEALANAAKHAQASVVELRVDDRDGGLTLWVRDDGIGGADPRRGSGITGLKDRVAALGGTISVLSPPGHGTTLHVQLPAGRRE